MNTIDFTNIIPELAKLIEVNQKINQMESLLDMTRELEDNILASVSEKLFHYEQDHNCYLGEIIKVEYNKQQFLVSGLNADPDEKVKVILLDTEIIIKEKQTKGNEGEKEQS